MNSSLAKQIIPLLPDNLEIKMVEEGILITGVIPTPTDIAPATMPVEIEKTPTPETRVKNPFLIPEELSKIALTPTALMELSAMCKEYLELAASCWKNKGLNNIEMVRRQCNKKNPRLNSALGKHFKDYTLVDRIEYLLIDLNATYIRSICKS